MAAKKSPVKVAPLEDHRARLTALRDQLEAALKTCSENMLPQLSGQYRATLADLATLPPEVPAEETKLDELRKRRESKHTGTPSRGATSAPARAPKPASRQRRA